MFILLFFGLCFACRFVGTMPARVVLKLPLLHEFEAWVEAQPCATVASRLAVVIDGPASPFEVLCSLVKQHASKEEGRFYTNLRDLWTARFRQALPEEVAFAEGLVARVRRMAESVTPRSPTELMSSIKMEQQDEQQDESGESAAKGVSVQCCPPSVSNDGSASMPGSASISIETAQQPTTAAVASVEALPAISELEKINKIDDFRKRAKALGLDVRCKKPDGNGWAWRSREDVLNDYARKLAEAGGATLPIGTGSVPQTAGASSAVLRNSSLLRQALPALRCMEKLARQRAPDLVQFLAICKLRQALPVRVRKPRVGLPLSIDILLRPRERRLRTLHRCQALPAAAWRRRTDLHLLMPVVWKLCQRCPLVYRQPR